MSKAVLVMGESGSGKSTSIRNLDPKTTFIINTIDKPLPFKGARNKYSFKGTEEIKCNYFASDNPENIIQMIQAINLRRPEITTIIIDDFQYIMANEYMRRAKERGYDRFTDIASNAWNVINALKGGREDIDAFILSHTELDSNGKVKIKTIGKMLDTTITVEGMFTVVLHSLYTDQGFKFLTQYDGTHIARSPAEMFPATLIDNDLAAIKQQLNSYEF